MDRKNKIHEEAERIFSQNKPTYSTTEIIILLQSQYYNIEDLFTYRANLKDVDINHKNEVSEKIISISNSFQNNLKLIPNGFGWGDSENQIERVANIKNEVEKTIEIEKVGRDYQNNPSLVNYNRLQRLLKH